MVHAMQHGRLFLACDIDADVKVSLRDAMGRISRDLSGVRWCAEDALHLTLHFFGDTPLDEVRAIDRAVCKTRRDEVSYAFSVTGIGMFPHTRRPRVIWAGIDEGAARLCALTSSLSSQLSSEGFHTEDRAFVPHVTVGRFRSRGRVDPAVCAQIVSAFAEVVFGHVDPDELVLYSSELTSRGPRYTRMASWPLGADSK